MMTAEEIIRAAIPGASEGLCDHILWARTPFPIGRVTAQSLYRAASAWRRAYAKNIELCEFCHRKATDGTLCERCSVALRQPHSAGGNEG